jgi:hypothetical protein
MQNRCGLPCDLHRNIDYRAMRDLNALFTMCGLANTRLVSSTALSCGCSAAGGMIR